MIKFFRKIRQDLLTENRFSKYLIYAIGEIVLVVIGILIALQINNWNENRKEGKFEQKLYTELMESLKRNNEQLIGGIKYSEESIKSCQVILKHIEDNLPYQDTLDKHFATSLRWWHPTLRNNAFESLKNHYGLHLLKNDSIRNQLSLINELDWLDFLIVQQEDYFSNTIGPLLPSLFKEYSVEKEMEPYNFDELRNSRQYLHILNTSIDMRRRQIRWYKFAVNSREEIIAMIIDEIKIPRN